MATSFDLVNRALQGTLEARLRNMRDEGWSMTRIAQTLTSEGYPIGRETVRLWLQKLGMPSRVHFAPAAPTFVRAAS